MSKYTFVDWSNVAHACFCVLKIPSDALHDEVDWGAYFTLLSQRLSNLNKIAPDHQLVIVLDNKAVRKARLYPAYKLGRDIPPIAIQMANGWAKEKRKFVCESPGEEADDAIATLTGRNGNSSIIISGDRDLWQLYGAKVRIWHPTQNRFIDNSDIEKSFGNICPAAIALYKACWGDVGDNVPNILPRMQKQLLPIIQESEPTLDGFKSAVKRRWKSLSQRCRDLYFANEDLLEINYQLVKLETSCNIVWHELAEVDNVS